MNKKEKYMKSILFFDNMLTPKIITLVYWLLLLATVAGGFGFIFGGYEGFTFGKLFMGVFYMLAGAVGARIWCD
jgi:hypothetical protein